MYCMGEMRNEDSIFVAKPNRKRPLGRYNIRMYLREMGWEVWTRCIWLRIGTSD
jgi:hypothetical protein